MKTAYFHRLPLKYRIAIGAARFVTGRELDGRPRTNATWKHRGAVPLTQTGHASRWAHQTYGRRAGVRNGVLAAVVLIGVGLVVSPTDTVTTLRVLALVGMLALGWMWVEKYRRWSKVTTYVIPTATALADMLGVSRHTDPQSWVHVPNDHRTNPDKPVIIDLPDTYHAPVAQQKRLADIAAKRLQMASPDWGIDWEGDHPTLWLRACPSPPELVTFNQVRELAEQATSQQVVLGFGSRMTPGVVSLSDDSPHILASIGTGGGKSNFGKWVALQFLRRGSRIVIIDIVKRGGSHKWAKGVPGVEIYRHPDVAHTALLELSELVETRCETAWHHGVVTDDQQTLLIIEESNRTLRKLQSYWVNELGETKTSLAILAIEGILCVGREAGVNVLTVGQRMSAAASGGGDARENYGVKLANRFSRQTAKMLFGDCQPLPPNVVEQGRVQVVIGQSATEMQLPYLPDTDPEPVQWALAGCESSRVVDTAEQLNSTPCDLGKHPVQDTATVLPFTPPTGRLVALSEAAAELGMKVTQLRNARARDKDFPPERGRHGQHKLYRLDELKRWAPNRVRRDAAQGDGH